MISTLFLSWCIMSLPVIIAGLIYKEAVMANAKDVLSWAERDLSRFCDQFIQITSDNPEGAAGNHIRFSIFTKTNEYMISANDINTSDGYLGCISKCRTPRAGEDWRRGRDMADGYLSEDTWAKILIDIVSYELVNIAKSAEPVGIPG